MINTFAKTLLRDCRNMRLHVLFCLWAFSTPPTATDIATAIPMDRGVCNGHLHGLESDGYAAHAGQRWFLTDKGKQLPLPGLFLAQSEGNSLTLPLTTTTVFSSFSEPMDQLSSSSSNQSEGKTLTLAQSPLSREEEDALSELHKIGIMGKKALELARLEWVTPRYVTAMHARWQQEGYARRDTGLLIRYIADGDPAPDICEECGGVGGHHADCQSMGNLDLLVELVATGEVPPIKAPSTQLVQAMMKYNQQRLTIDY